VVVAIQEDMAKGIADLGRSRECAHVKDAVEAAGQANAAALHRPAEHRRALGLDDEVDVVGQHVEWTMRKSRA
jgi:hypothetical protein